MSDEEIEYTVQIHIIEGRNIKGKDASGTSDPFVKIICNGQEQLTKAYSGMNNCRWDQSFTFSKVLLTQRKLELSELQFQLYDRNKFLTDFLIGSYSIGLSTMHNNLNHEFYRVWLPIMNETIPEEAQAFLLVSAVIIGIGENLPFHKEDIIEEDEGIDANEIDQLTIAQRKAIDLHKKDIHPIDIPDVFRKGYQLAIFIIKGENMLSEEGLGAAPNYFVSVSVGGCILATEPCKESLDPKFYSVMLFPVYMPILNDKIKVCIWNKRSAFVPDDAIGTIPENPSKLDPFNISKIQSTGGKVLPTYYNIYGTPPTEKGYISNSCRARGVAFLGQLLISMQLSPKEKPQLCQLSSNPAVVPPKNNFKLSVDIRELRNCKRAREEVWVVVNLANKTSQKSRKAKRQANNIFQWESGAIEDVITKLPSNIIECPDIFLYVFTGTLLGGSEKIGYVRIPLKKHSDDTEIKSDWAEVIDFDDPNGLSGGNLLYSIQFGSEEMVPLPREPAQCIKYFMTCSISHANDLAPGEPEENMSTYIEVIYNNIKFPNLKASDDETCYKLCPKGKNPFYNCSFQIEFEVDGEVRLAPPIQIDVYNIKKGRVYGYSRELIGSTRIKLDEQMIDDSENVVARDELFKFYTLERDGLIEGKIYCLLQYGSGQINNAKNQQEYIVTPIFNDENYFDAELQLGILGVRNLPRNTTGQNVEIIVKLASQFYATDDEKSKEADYSRYQEIRHVIKQDTNKIIAKDSDKAKEFAMMSETSTKNIDFYTISKIPIRLYKDDPLRWPMLEIKIVDNAGILPNRPQYANYPLFLSHPAAEKIGIQRSQYILLYTLGLSRKVKAVEKSGISNPRPSQSRSSRSSQNHANEARIVRQRIQLEDVKENEYEENKEEERQKLILNTEQANNIELQDNNNEKANNNDDEEALPDFNIGSTMKFTSLDKEVIESAMKQAQSELETKITILNPKEKKEKNKLFQQIEKIKLKIMDEKEFHDYNDYDYEDELQEQENGREYFTGGDYETALDIPYIRLPLFYSQTTFVSNSISDTYRKEEDMTGAVLKLAIKLTTKESQQTNTGTENLKEKDKLIIEKENEDALNQKKKEEEESVKLAKNILKNHKFSLTNEDCMNYICKYEKIVISNFRIYKCSNLAAVSESVDFKQLISGGTNKVSANPYVILDIGDGNDANSYRKHFDDVANVQMMTLNPVFHKLFSLKFSLPNDNMLTFKLLSKRKVITDVLIGTLYVDLEDRYYGELFNQAREALNAACEKATKDKKESKDVDMEKITSTLNEIMSFRHELQKMGTRKSKIEYKQLKDDSMKYSHGLAEFSIDIASIEDSLPEGNYDAKQVNGFELRIIIWEVAGVEVPPGGAVDLFLKLCFEEKGWREDEIIKQTDVHYGSKDGHGIFNYRFKFSLEFPGEPRLKIQLKDHHAISADTAIGEIIINIGKMYKRVKNQGLYDSGDVTIPFKNPNTQTDDVVGIARIAITIVSQEEARSQPVGEAQEEPNVNPTLTKPTEGRGLLAFLSGTPFDLAGLRLPRLTLFRNIMFLVGGVVGIGAIVIITKFI